MKNFFLLTLFVMLSTGIAPAQENPNIFKHKVGDAEVILLSEGQQKGNKSILIGATEDMLAKYAPDGTFPNATNAFVVKIGGKNILIDTGLGRELFANLKSVGLTPEQIDAVIITHMHGDHTGGMLKDGEKAFPKAEIYIAAPEADYWNSAEKMNLAPENRRGGFTAAQNIIKTYSDKLHLFTPANIGVQTAEIIQGITPAAAFGHTPGHTAFLIQSQGEKILVWGDLTHAMAIQMPYPDVAVTYDVNPEIAVRYRKQILEYVAKNKIPVAGMHIAYPAMGNVEAGPSGGYIFIPVSGK